MKDYKIKRYGRDRRRQLTSVGIVKIDHRDLRRRARGTGEQA